jgi:glycine dehydrogenase
MRRTKVHDFKNRHIGPVQSDLELMLRELNLKSLDELIQKASPESIRMTSDLNLPAPLTEAQVLEQLKTLAAENDSRTKCLIGQGYYNTFVPTVILRNVLENPAWYTSYTPYQPEISQGRLEALINFQTMITDLTGLDIAGASLLDEPTAVAEAMTLMLRQHKGESKKIYVDRDTHPQTLNVLKTRAVPLGIDVEIFDIENVPNFSDSFGVIASYPSSSGVINDLSELVSKAHSSNNLVCFATDLLALTILPSAAKIGADIAVGSAQRFGVPMGFGGPHAGFMAVRAGLERTMPGRLVGVSIDTQGKRAYRLALQTREQHIRREKATSNICTAQALLAVMSGMYAAYHGLQGLQEIALCSRNLASQFANSVRKAGGEVKSDKFFDTVAFSFGNNEKTIDQCLGAGFNIRLINSKWLSVSFDETSTTNDVERICAAIGISVTEEVVDDSIERVEPALTHPVFNSYQSETEMMRYLRKLSDFDLALDRTMIPLGSCTMKLNAATEMAAVTWPEFANAHPFAPEKQNLGWRKLIKELETYLCEVTGYDAVSLQPNAGSQGEFAGLLAIAGYHQSRGEGHRNVCLIPSSAHGTNAASAVMAGMKVVVIGCDDKGNVDLADLHSKIAEHAKNLAAIMITYPSTHGVFEETVTEICASVHEAGGQVYIDGANLNALVAIAQPGKFGSDVSHLNLHKTFCIPHGGGGPGVGPVGVRAHLAEFLPSSPIATETGAISGSEFGSAGILPIPYAYIRMMSSDGLKLATQTAILSANYISKKLSSVIPTLYTNENGLVAHECILDFRDITKETGVTVDDVAKRLIDFGFHAPTMSFPVAGTLMIEPTESESLFEIERFINAMLQISKEIEEVRSGAVQIADSALRNAPHTSLVLLAGDLDSEERLKRAFPEGVNPSSKYWPPVSRIDGAYGDRNLVCACPPIEDFAN